MQTIGWFRVFRQFCKFDLNIIRVAEGQSVEVPSCEFAEEADRSVPTGKGYVEKTEPLRHVGGDALVHRDGGEDGRHCESDQKSLWL